MSLLKKAWNFVRWFAPIQRWTTAITVVLAGGTLLWIVALGLGLTSLALAPGEVVVAMYQAAQDGDRDLVRNYLSDDARKQFDLLSPDDEAALLALLNSDGQSVALSPLGVRNYGKNSVTGLIQDLSTGLSKLRVEVLVREGRFWRVEWPVGVADFSEAVRRFDPYYELIYGPPDSP